MSYDRRGDRRDSHYNDRRDDRRHSSSGRRDSHSHAHSHYDDGRRDSYRDGPRDSRRPESRDERERRRERERDMARHRKEKEAYDIDNEDYVLARGGQIEATPEERRRGTADVVDHDRVRWLELRDDLRRVRSYHSRLDWDASQMGGGHLAHHLRNKHKHQYRLHGPNHHAVDLGKPLVRATYCKEDGDAMEGEELDRERALYSAYAKEAIRHKFHTVNDAVEEQAKIMGVLWQRQKVLGKALGQHHQVNHRQLARRVLGPGFGTADMKTATASRLHRLLDAERQPQRSGRRERAGPPPPVSELTAQGDLGDLEGGDILPAPLQTAK